MAKVFWVVIVVCVVGSFVWLADYKDKLKKQPIYVEHLNEAPVVEIPYPTEEGWFDKITQFSKDYAYPTEEFSLLVDFVDPNQKQIPQRLLINAIDSFKFLCVSEVLREKNVEFAYSKNHNSVDVIIYLPYDYTKAQNLIQELKYYDIAFTYK